MSRFIEPEGERIEPDRLSLPRARAFAGALADGVNDYARLIECRTTTTAESVVFEVDVELGQLRIHPIQHRERLLARFARDDQTTPEVLALRDDFPSVPHLNLQLREVPRSLCLYDELFRDVKKSWTAPRFIERIREWLALTAKGTLHQDDQPLEPLFFASHHVILPDGLFDDDAALSRRLHVDPIRYPDGRLVCILEKAPAESTETDRDVAGAKRKENPPEFVAMAFLCSPQEHGIIRKQPTALRELHDVLGAAGTDLLGELRARLVEWDSDEPSLGANVLLIVACPKTRAGRGGIEATDVWTFLTGCSLRELGKQVGVWDLTGQQRGRLLMIDESRRGEDVPLDLFHTHFSLSRPRAALLNGQQARIHKKIVAIGAGALGSQVVANLVRAAFGEWTIIDDDMLLPHNLARHALHGGAEGHPKAYAVAHLANSVIDGDPIAQGILADVLEPGAKQEAVTASLAGADLVVDLSASVAVARHLAGAGDSRSRRISLFMNPTGGDLVLLAEDAERSTGLDSVEMQYYRALASDPLLAGHFKPNGTRRRYGQSCRDVTSDIPQDLVALHAATASRAVKAIAAMPGACIAVWRSDPEGNVRRVDVEPSPAIRLAIGDWTVCTDEFLVRRIAALREAKLPSETGGVLVGSFDHDRRIAYIVDTIPSPPDSEEWPTLYIRGCRGLTEKVEEIAERTDGMLEYIGEWHSHPRGCPPVPSSDDLQVFAWLTEVMDAEGLPALMMIAGDGSRVSCYIGRMSRDESPLPEVTQ